MKLRIFTLLVSLLAVVQSFAEAKYIFYFIGDGMGPGQVISAQTYNRLVLQSDELLPMMQLPVNSIVTTYSTSSTVTDSAAAGTALSTGTKTRNGMLGMAPDTVPVYSVAKTLHENGYGVAIITTVALDDATPGAFYAHVPKRSKYYEIGRQAAESGYELIGGSSLRGKTDKNGNSTGLVEYIQSCGVDIVEGVEALRNSDNRRNILIPDKPVWSGNMGYAIDEIEGAMNLADMTEAAIEHLQKYTPDKFFIMAEGGSIDHAGHANDGGTAIRETLAFNDAIAKAIEFYNQHPDETLIVVTADHETGGMSLGNVTTGYSSNLQYFAHQKYSKERFSNYCDDLFKQQANVTWDDMKQHLTENFGFFAEVPVDEAQEQRLHEAFDQAFINGSDDRQETLYANVSQFTVEVFDLLNDLAGIGWTTFSHSGNQVPLYATGAGSELFVGQNDNTDVPKKIRKAAGIE